jgi:hypothetical protein
MGEKVYHILLRNTTRHANYTSNIQKKKKNYGKVVFSRQKYANTKHERTLALMKARGQLTA